MRRVVTRSSSIAALIGVLMLASAALPTMSCADNSTAPSVRLESEQSEVTRSVAARDHREMFLKTGLYPSAAACRDCHPGHYEEWAASSHAYAQISPIFNAMHGTILKLTNGTNGDFCIRCHTPVGMQIGEPLFVSNAERGQTSIEGITCIVCHRIKPAYGKVSSRLALAAGDIFQPVYGPVGNNDVLLGASGKVFRVEPEASGSLDVHGRVERVSHLAESSFCGICHDVNLMNGFRLEEAFSEYKSSPAAARGVSCQDCHMVYDYRKPGEYRKEVIVEVPADVGLKPRKRTNHRFIGPDYSIVHPGIFPHNPDAKNVADDPNVTMTMADWLQFDWKYEKWGSSGFEREVRKNREKYKDHFPKKWSRRSTRAAAYDLIQENLEMLENAQQERIALLSLGYQLGLIVPIRVGRDGIKFKIEVRNGMDGHGVPTGFDAERIVYLRVRVKDREGRIIMRSGDLDKNGDLRDLHSLYVHNHKVPLDRQLFNLQSKFITRNLRGGEREQVLAVNTSIGPLPFVRPSTTPTILTGRPGGARKHKQNILPGDSRWAEYEVKAAQLSGKGPYRAEVALVAGMVPVNLVDAIKEVGFDYGMTPREVADAVVSAVDHDMGGRKRQQDQLGSKYGGHTILHETSYTFDLHQD